MFNLRVIDRFVLAGQWEDPMADLDMLTANGVRAVLDLEFGPQAFATDGSSIELLNQAAAARGLDYRAIPFVDSDDNADLDAVYEDGEAFLARAEAAYPDPADLIVVKCAGGVSRSPSMLADYYCASRGLTYPQAIGYIHQREAGSGGVWRAEPRPAFVAYLTAKFDPPR